MEFQRRVAFHRRPHQRRRQRARHDAASGKPRRRHHGLHRWPRTVRRPRRTSGTGGVNKVLRNEPAITPELVAQHGLKPDEYERILKLIGRTPSFTELGIFSAMWNEHCSYKSSRLHLKGL